MKISFLIFPFLISLLSIPLVKRIGEKFKFIDLPDLRKQHKITIVRIGGISIFLGLISSLLVNKFFNLDLLITTNELFVPFLISITAFFLLGLIEDIFVLKPLHKLLVQIIIGIYAFLNGLRIDFLDISYLGLDQNVINFGLFISFIITLIWIVGITNAFNWMDGLDGLSAGISIIFCINLIILNQEGNNLFINFLLIPLIGSCLGFLKYNFYPSKILMGDSGSFLLGSFLGLSSLIVFRNEASLISLNLPFFFYIYPILDMSFVILIRILRGYSALKPDRSHLHYRLIDSGISHRNTVLLIYGIVFAISGLNYLN